MQPGLRLLDLNAGWGALALYLAEQARAQVTAMFKTREQLRFAQSEARRRGLEAHVHFRLGSFHQCRGRFDRILASGLFERFTESTYPVLFQHFDELLEDDGFVWIQVTGRSKDNALSNRWYQATRFYRHRNAISQRFGERHARHWEFQLASQAAAMHWGQLSQYEVLAGNTRSVCPAFDQALQTPADSLPADIANRIPGLARPT